MSVEIKKCVSKIRRNIPTYENEYFKINFYKELYNMGNYFIVKICRSETIYRNGAYRAGPDSHTHNVGIFKKFSEALEVFVSDDAEFPEVTDTISSTIN